MANTPFFSIIIPMYNSERYIKVCVDSILAQTFKNYEVIIIDDASTDNSVDICQKLYGKNWKIRIIKQKNNGGAGVARNVGLKSARGEYIFFVDSDDAIILNALEKLYNHIDSKGGGRQADAIHLKGWFRTDQDDDKPLDVNRILLKFENNPNVGFLPNDIVRRLEENWAIHRIVGYVCNTVYRRKFLLVNKIEFPDKHCITEDQIIHFYGMCFAQKYLMVRDAIYIYRVRPKSLSHKPDVEIAIKSMIIVIKHFKKIFYKIPEIRDNRYLMKQCCASTLEATLRDIVRPFYDGMNIPPELDQKVYETMLPIFGENTTLVKYLFHGFNTMWRQANNLAIQNHFLLHKEKLLKEQKNLLEKISQLVNSNENLIHQNTLLANQNKMLEQMSGLLEQQSRQLKQPQK